MIDRLRNRFAPVALAVAIVLAACQGSPSSAVTPTSPAQAPTSVTSDSGLPQVVPPEQPLEAPSEVPEELKAIWEAWAYLTRDHVDRSKLDPKVFTEAAIQGMLEALDDPHTSYLGPEAFAIDNEDLQGRFEGIGAEVSTRRDGKLIVVAPIPGSPAEAAGIRPGDVILEVNGESLEGVSLLEAVKRIRGPRGTSVRLLIQHLGSVDPVLVEVQRGVIPLVSVRLRSDPGEKLAHIRLTSFYADTPQKLAETIKQAVDSGAQGIILDVRDNPGGLLNSVVEVASLFLKDGLVVYEVDGSGRRTNWSVRQVEGASVARDLPMVVLVNEFSASASEVLVGALQDYERATVIGATTFGKGSVNILRPLSNGGGLYITYARWYTPEGRLIEGQGITPDVLVTARDPRDADVMQLEKAREVLQSLIDSRKAG